MHIFCEACEKLICDKCEVEDHLTHKRQSFLLTKEYTYLANIIKIDTEKIKKNSENLRDFSETIDRKEIETLNYFDSEFAQIHEHVHQIIDMLTENLQKINLLFNRLKTQFSEDFGMIKVKYAVYEKELSSCIYYF